MKVFIEQNRTSSPDLHYPYPYGYILDTKAPDGSELDCYIVTDDNLPIGEIINVEIIGMVEWFEGKQDDHKILTRIINSTTTVTPQVQKNLLDFADQYMKVRKRNDCRVGVFKDVTAAQALLEDTQS